jgi:hypothetical protein
MASLLHPEDRSPTRHRARARARVIATPHGIRSFIDDQQLALDAVKAKTDAFITDIENHFGPAAKYLTPAYTGRSKFENVEKGVNRRIGVQWLDRVYSYDDVTATTVAFVYTETDSGVRLDYIQQRVSGPKDVINDDYNPERDDIYKTRYSFTDAFRTVRRYDNHEAFVNSGDHPPEWFLDALSHRKPTPTP